MTTALLILAGYVLGSMPWGYWLVRLFKGEDIRKHIEHYVIARPFFAVVNLSRANIRRKIVGRELANDALSPLFQAVIEATEEAIYNSLCMAETVRGYHGHVGHALPLDQVRTLLRTSAEG